MWNPGSWTTTLPILLAGMLGIFLVIALIVGVVYLLKRVTKK